MMDSKQPLPAANDDAQAADFAADQASRCRRLAQAITDRDTAQMLQRMAVDYDRQANGSPASR